MMISRCLAALAVAAMANSMGCSGRTPQASTPAAAASPSAETPHEAFGRTEMQPPAAPSATPAAPTTEETPLPPMPPPAPDAIVGIRPDGTLVTAAQAGLVTDAGLPVPPASR
jgi:hypothetical protein